MTDLERAIETLERGLVTPRRTLRQRMVSHKVPAFSIALIDQGELAWAKGYGVLEAGGDQAVTTETLFQAASISKPVTAMVACILVEAGALDLDADVNTILSSWKLPKSKHTLERPVTLRGLLSHTSGVGVYGYPGYPAGAPLPTLQQILDGKPPALHKPVRMKQAPGTGFLYSGGAYMMIQQMIEDVTGRPLADLAQEWIFHKLGMARSTFDSLLPETYIPQAATAHKRDGTAVPGKWHIYPEQATASLWSTPSDLARLVIEVLKSYKGESNLVHSVEMTRQMLTRQESWIGLGFPIIEEDGLTKFEHPGWNEGFHSLMVGCLETGCGLVWMTNGAKGKHLGREVMRALPKAFVWSGYP
jgi:CubicO group peptidase (beta-lactamase class C family)